MATPILKVENLQHVYPGGVVALRDVNLEIKPAEIVGVIGQNGSGKTTLVKHFNNLLKPTTGKVYFNGDDTAPLTVQQMSKNVGYVYQNPNQQLFARTVQAELEFGPRNLGVSEEEIQERCENAVEFFGLQELREKHPYRIGFPLRKLVGMASIYTMKPAVFILDEPTTGQDNITTQTVYRLIRRLRDEGATVVCVAHDMILLAEVVDRLIVMRDSLLIADGKPREIFSNHELLASTHLMPPQITELSLRMRKNGSASSPICLSVDEYLNAVKQLRAK
ncbi:MAG TPA: ATP-binding cassette domain-containing protein [Longilinea sp.]|nr:ATP-binding cassette domain-containing protein [Longilinea sp.]